MMCGELGYLYVLINPSMQGLVKVGRTSQDPEARAKELSSATGVPTPFVIVYHARFGDCVEAEQYVHTLLETKGCRLSPNREFFLAPVKDVVDAVVAAERDLRSTRQTDAQRDAVAVGGGGGEPSEPWREVFALAEAALYGLGDTFQTESDALDLYRKARRLGSRDACLRIGSILRARGSTEDRREALESLEDGARRGLEECFAELGLLFFGSGQVANARKAWGRYLASDAFRLPTVKRAKYGWDYLVGSRRYSLPTEHREVVKRIREEVSAFGQGLLEEARQKNLDGAEYLEVDKRFIDHVLYPERPRQTVLGVVKWFQGDNGYGFLRLDSGVEAYIHQDFFMDAGPDGLKGVPRQGERVRCEIVDGRKGPLGVNVERI
jgi:cold shock CspA family protein